MAQVMHEVTLTSAQEQKLRHMLGAEPGRYPKKRWGFRNHYCGVPCGDPDLDALCAIGLAKRASDAPAGMGEYSVYVATRAGCEAVGMSKAAIKRCFERK